MHFTAQNEALLRDALRSGRIHEQIGEISDKIEELEKDMASHFNSAYIDVITKCAVLERLHTDATEMKQMSLRLLASAEDVQLRQASIEEEYAGVQSAIERLREVQSEFAGIREFIGCALRAERTESVFEMVQSLQRMAALKVHFKKYNFYKVVKGCYESARKHAHAVLSERAAAWADGADLAWIGRRARAWDRHGIFDCVLLLRADVVDVGVRETAYAARRVGLEKAMGEVLDKRIEQQLLALVRRAEETDTRRANEVVPLATGLVLFSYYAAELFPDCRVFSERILGAVEKAEQCDLLGALALREVLEALRLSSSLIDGVVETTAFRHFNKRMGADNFRERIEGFIDESAEFLQRHSGSTSDLDDLFAQKVDRMLAANLQNTLSKHAADCGGFAEADDYAEKQAVVFDALAYLRKKRPSLAGFSFAVRDDIEKQNDRHVHAAYETTCARVKKAQSSEEIVRALLALKDFMNEGCRKRVVELLSDSSKELMRGRSSDELALFRDTLARNFGSEQ
ncbi:hypothetical protein PAPHI01_2094 [Pancytospora philotis]|nr:hypothetical protein PAPHI01_2094 [Pancytospora philotis]